MHVRFHEPIGEVFFALCKAIDSPVSLGYWLRFKYSQDCLANDSISAHHYLDRNVFRADYTVSEFLSKYKGLNTGIDTADVAFGKFKLAEETNRETNRRIRAARSTPTGVDVESVIHTARRIISNILGPLNVSKVLRSPKWSPGSTSTIRRERARVDNKMLTVPISVTPRAKKYFRTILHEDLHWCASLLGVFPEGPFCFTKETFLETEENRVVMVPKNAKTDRVIAAEPTANVFLQKSVGEYLKRRLASFGVDLSDQSVNQRMAAYAYHYDYATLDLKAASDTISLELVYDLLPVDWAIFLDDLRCPKGRYKNELFVYEKFSSMGNAFTFELESMIFYALSQGVLAHISCASPPFVYGDDIILPREGVPLLSEVFTFCGFSLNQEKSHIDGNFFESCGKHYYEGHDVTPPYQKEILNDLQSSIRLGNRLIRNLHDTPYFRKAWEATRRFGGGHSFVLPFGCQGDDAWIVPLDEFKPERSSRNHGFKCRVLKTRFHKIRVQEDAFYAYQLRLRDESQDSLMGYLHHSDSGPFDGKVSTDRVKSVKTGFRWVHISDVCPLDS